MSEKQARIRAELKKAAIDPELSEDERQAACARLSKLPRNSAKSGVSVRCSVTGRGRAVYRKFGISRIAFREFALKGYLPGVKKASW